MAEQDNYQLLVQKLDQFIRKYYVNQLIRGGLYSLGTILLLFLVLSGLEHFFRFDSAVRTVFIYSFLGISLLALGVWVFQPLLHYFRLGKIISHRQAAEIIGNHFTDVKDKLLNVLQLRDQMDESTQKELILASIRQKSDDIKLVPFQSAINLGQNRRYLRYALPPFLILLLLIFAAPSFRDSTNRLINSGKEYERPAPFHFILPQEDLSVVQFEDFDLAVEVEGPQLPNEVFIDIDNYQYRLRKEAPNRFVYRFSNVQQNTDFSLYSSGVASDRYELEVLKKPDILDFEIALDYPAYTGRKDESIASIGDLVVPQGTRIAWDFHALNTDDIALRFSTDDTLKAAERRGDEHFTYQRSALRDATYKVFLSNADLPRADSILYSLSVIPDQYPQIEVEVFTDTLDEKLLFFVGEAGDDYGLQRLLFHYRLNPEKGEEGELNSTVIQQAPARQTQFDHTFDIRELGLTPGDEVVYYFEVFDNDAINGSKSSRTRLMTFAMPTVEEFREIADKNEEQVKSNLENALKESRQIQEEMKRMREKLLQEKEMDWQSREELEKLLNRQKDLQQQLEQAKQSFEENVKNQEEFTELDEEMLEKQEQLQKLFDEVMSDEMRKLMEQIEEMLQELEKEDALQMMEEFQFSDEELEKELDRLLELFKQLEMDKEMEEMVEQLEELAKQQEELAEATDELKESENTEAEDELENAENEAGEDENAEQEASEEAENEQNQESANEQQGNEKQEAAEEQQEGQENSSEQPSENEESSENQENQASPAGDQKPQTQEQLQEQQQDINESFQQLQEQMDEMQQKNQEMENPRDLGDQQQQMEDIQQDLNNSQQQLQQQQNNKASQSQKNAAQKMRQMAQSMSMQMQAQQMEQMQEDMQALRQLLENLVGLSFDQEDLLEALAQSNINTPRYTELVQKQFKLEDDFKLVEDSLQALAKRVFQIESFITEKVTEIKGNMRESLEDLEERRKLQASDHQQRTMKNVNDLALMLSEVMNQMQQQMAAMMSGNQMCTNPGQQGQEGQQPQDRISQGQQQLNEQMRKMKEALEQGRGGSSKEFAEMAAKQAALRKKLREQQQKLREQGQGDKELQQLIDQMDRVETELVNKQLSNEMIKRQQEILTRLLEHENAERQRKFDEQRKAEAASQQERKMPPSLEEYIKKRRAEIEMYKTVSPALKPYFKNLVEDYFKSLQSADK